MEIKQTKDNKLLNRQEIDAITESDSSPSKTELTKKLSEKTGKNQENIVIESIKGKFGTKLFNIKAKVYEDIESKKKYETITRKQRKQKLEEKAKAEEEAKKAKQETIKAKEIEKSEQENNQKEESKKESDVKKQDTS